MADSPDSRPAGGFGDAVSKLGASVLALLRTRLELATVEFAEERERVKQMLVLAVVATVFLTFALIALSVLVVLWFWDTNRIAAVLGVGLVYLAIGGAALAVLRAQGRAAAKPFAATLRELERDAESLRGKP